MNSMIGQRFLINEIFRLKDGRVVFAGSFDSAEKTFGPCNLVIDGVCIATLEIQGEIEFSSNDTRDIALYTFTPIASLDPVRVKGGELVFVRS